MKRRAIPEIPTSALRNYGDPERVERVWQRIEADVADDASPAQTARFSLWWCAPAAAVVLFGAGVFVGAEWARPEVAATVRAEAPSKVSAPASPAPVPNATTERKDEPPKVTRAQQPPRPAAVEPSAPVDLGALSEPAVAPTSPPTAPAAPAAWQRLANAGDFAGARLALERQGGFDAALATASPEELMNLADIARGSGAREQAIRALRQVLSAHSQAPEAPLAAWTLGNMLDKAGDRKGAAEAFALYQRLSPTGDFAEDAAARQVYVALSQGNPEIIAQLVEEYARNFPSGRRVAEFRRALAKLNSSNKDEQSDGTKSAGESEDEAVEGPLEPELPRAPSDKP